MGLDQYAYASSEIKSEDREEIGYWRKHNRLQGWMEKLWEDKGRPHFNDIENPLGDFNCQPVELTLSDIEQLEAHVENKALPETGGFFFGDDSFGWTDDDGNPPAEGDYYYKKTDLEFIALAREALQKGKKVFYDSWW
jgi:hypothetical protein